LESCGYFFLLYASVIRVLRSLMQQRADAEQSRQAALKG
jgi:hypothetical protein